MRHACAVLAFFVALPCRSEVIDRIAVSIGNQVITESQVIEEQRVTDFLNHRKPQITPESKKAAADRLIEQTLVRREMELSHFAEPDPAKADALEKNLRSQYAGDAAFDSALQEAGINLENLRRHLEWEVTLLGFIDYRFRPSVQVSEAAIKTYYDRERAEWERQGLQPIPSLADSRADIEKILTEQGVDRAMDRWLADTRTRVVIQYRQEAFE